MLKATIILLLLPGPKWMFAQASMNGVADRPLTATQQHLFKLYEGYKQAYSLAKSKEEAHIVKTNFKQQVKQFFVDTLERRSDSMLVRVGRIKYFKDNNISIQLHSGTIPFSDYGNLREVTERDRERVRQFIGTIKPNETILTRLAHQGGSIISNLGGKNFMPLTLFAFPVPLDADIVLNL